MSPRRRAPAIIVDYTTMTTFYRLLGFLRPYKRGLIVSWLLASLAMVMTVLIPYFTGSAVEAIKHGDSHAPATTSSRSARTTATRCSCSRS